MPSEKDKNKKVVSAPQNKKENIIDDTNTIRCPMCGDRRAISNHYKSGSPLYANNHGHMVFCKECVWSTYDTYFNILKDIRSSVYIVCMKFDIPFSESDYEGMKKQLVKDNTAHPMKTYMTKLNSLGAINNGLAGFDPSFLYKKETEKHDITSALEREVQSLDYNMELNEQEIIVKNDVIKLIGYDPFEGYSNFDQKFLYNELIPYLDEDTLEDSFKLSQIIQLVNNNNQIRKIDLVIAAMSNDPKEVVKNQGQIKSLTQTKQAIVTNTDKIAKENSISVKNRGDKSAGKSTLTYLMKNYRELGFEDAEQDYYDQKKAFGMKVVADISNKSIIEQLQFDENDMNDIFFTQRKLLAELHEKVSDLEEENRQLYQKIGLLTPQKD